MKNIWLFLDFDNTLMATEVMNLPTLVQHINNVYGNQLQRALTLEEYKKHFHGLSRDILCTHLSQHFGIEITWQKLSQGREWGVMQHSQQVGIEMAPNLLETLTSLSTQGVKFACVTNNSIQRGMASMRYATNGQGEALARLFGTNYFEAQDVQKPKPDIYRRAMQQVRADPSHSFAVEDSVTGVTAAVAAGLPTFGFLGFADEEHHEMEHKLLKAGAIATFHDWKDFEDLFKKFRSTLKN